MSRILSLFGLLALIGATWVVSSAPASAEFFGCNDRRGQVLYSYSGTPDRYVQRRRRYSAPRYSYSNSYAAQQRHRRHATYYGDSRYWNGR
jgi:hypothetical protein